MGYSFKVANFIGGKMTTSEYISVSATAKVDVLVDVDTKRMECRVQYTAIQMITTAAICLLYQYGQNLH